MASVFRNRLLASTLMLGVAGIAGSMLVASPAAAQDFTNVNAQGRVTDASGKPVQGATVTVTSNAQGFSQTVTTDSDGSYRATALPQGTYTFEIAASGYATFRDDNVVLTQSSAGNNFELGAASAVESSGAIVVTGRRVKVSDFDRTTSGLVISVADIAARVPVSRDLTSVILLAPGTLAGDTAFGNLPSIAGSSVSENVFFVNGLNITDFRQGLGSVEVPFEFYNTVEVKNGGIPAEFGRFSGGFVNATTKSGGNDFHGSVLFNWAPNELLSDRKNTLIDQNDQDTAQTTQGIFSVSGPIWKDHLFFYGFYQSNSITSGNTLLTTNPNTVVAGAAVPPYSTGLRREIRNNTSPFWGGKIDFIPFAGQRLEFTYFNSSASTTLDSYAITDVAGGGYDSRFDPAGPRVGAYQSTALLLSGGENFVGRYTGQIFNWLTLSGAYGQNRRQDVTGSTAPNYPGITDTSGRFSPALTGNAVNALDSSYDLREFYRADAEVFVKLFGEHHFKGGYDRENLTTDATTSNTGGVFLTYVNSGPTGDVYAPTPNTLYVTGRVFVNGGVFTSKNEAYYLQDSWSLFQNRLTLNLGVRNDRFENSNVAGEVYYRSGNQWAPRLAAAFDVFGDSRTKLYGSFGRYYLPVVANTNIRLAGAELDYTRYNVVAGVNPDNTPILGAPLLGFADATACPDTGIRNCDIISDGVATPTIATVAQGLKPQSVDEYQLGLEHRIGSRLKVGIFGQYRKLNESLEDVAIDAAVNAYCAANRIAGCEDIFTGFHQYVLSNPGSDARITLSDPIGGETSLRTVDFTAAQLGYPKATRTYKAVTLQVEREFDGKWSFNGAYTLSESRGNIEGGIRSDNGQDDSGLTTAFDQPGLTNGTTGLLPTNSTHIIKLFGSYALTKWFTFGAQFQALSPRSFGCIGRVPQSVDAFAGAYGAAGFYCNLDASGNVITNPAFTGFSNGLTTTSLQLTPRGSQLKSDWTTFLNLSAVFRVPVKAFDATLRVDAFNIFNSQAVTDLRELGTQGNGRPRGDYGSPLAYQAPRSVRIQLGVAF